MKREIKIFFTALMFYTRIPCPKWVDHSDSFLNLSTRYFPLVGWIVASITLLFFWLSSFVFPAEIGIILSMIAGVLTTGAFHEDGFADVCDGFGGGWTKEKIMIIMKDSRVGTYGVVGLIFIFFLKFQALMRLMPFGFLQFAMIVFAAHAISRLAAVMIISTSQYAREEDGKAKPLATQTATITLVIAMVTGLLPFVILCYFHYLFIAAVVPVMLTTFFLRRYFVKWIGGYTGDCLGATQQINEVVFYLSCLAICNYI
jgi:adenosylcobinamide-GDP ribazoletransferase